ncbi:MAG: TRAP transporter small permease [Gammaproteobacteria bacterium]|nr:TRAP transporter small permease [Gammaproteobacteria bacterium]
MSWSRLLHTIRFIEESLITLLLSAMVLLAGTQILLRNLFDSGLYWADPVLRLLVLWLTMLGALLATRHNQHIRIDLLSRYLSPNWRQINDSIGLLFSSAVCAILAWHSLRFVYAEYLDGSTLFGSLPLWLGQLILPLGFALMALRFAILCRQSIREQA